MEGQGVKGRSLFPRREAASARQRGPSRWGRSGLLSQSTWTPLAVKGALHSECALLWPRGTEAGTQNASLLEGPSEDSLTRQTPTRGGERIREPRRAPASGRDRGARSPASEKPQASSTHALSSPPTRPAPPGSPAPDGPAPLPGPAPTPARQSCSGARCPSRCADWPAAAPLPECSAWRVIEERP